MGILNTLNQIKNNGFDAKIDSVSTNGKLESGTYPVRIKSSELSVSKAGREQIAITLEVVSGASKDRIEMIFMSFEDTLPEFVLEKNGRTLLKLAEYANVTFTQNDLADELTTAEALRRGLGNQFIMKLSVVPNKKNPDYPYRNYDFAALEADPFQGNESADDSLDLGDLPF